MKPVVTESARETRGRVLLPTLTHGEDLQRRRGADKEAEGTTDVSNSANEIPSVYYGEKLSFRVSGQIRPPVV